MKIFFKKAHLIIGLIAAMMSPAVVFGVFPDLGTSGSYGVLSSTFTLVGGISTVTGDAGFTSLSGGGTHTVSGTDIIPAPPQSGLDQAAALVSLNSAGCTYLFATGAIDLAADSTHGVTGIFTPGVYCVDGAMSIGGTITLSGSGTYIFRSTGSFNMTDNSKVLLTGGAQACDVFWTPAQSTTIGATCVFEGTIIDDAGITVGNMTSWTGRALAFGGTVTFDTDAISIPLCAEGSPTDTSTITETPTITPASTETETWTLTVTGTQTSTATYTSSGTETHTQTPSDTETDTHTVTPTMTDSVTGTLTAVNTDTSTATETQTNTGTLTQTLTATLDSSSTDTPTQTPSGTQTDTFTVTPTITETATGTLTAVNTDTSTATGTSTITGTSTKTLTATETSTEADTFTATLTYTQSETASVTMTQTVTGTDVNTGTVTQTPTATCTFTEITTPQNADLGLSGSYGVLSSTFTRNGGISSITGDVAYTSLSGGGSHTASGTTVVPASPQSGLDQATALVALDNQACTYVFPTGAIDLESDTTHGSTGIYTPGVYCVNGAMSIGGGGIITLNGKGTYIFRSTGAFTSTDNSKVVLTGGAEACDVFWTPGQAATLGANSVFIGTVIDDAGITVGNMVSWTGRALAFGGTVTMDTDAITVPVCGAIGTPTQTSNVTNTTTPSYTEIETQTTTPTITITLTSTETALSTDTFTVTPSITETQTGTITQTLTETPTNTGTYTITMTSTDMDTQTMTPDITQTPTQTMTATVVPTMFSILDLGLSGSYAVLSSTFTRNGGISALTGDAAYTSLSGGGSHTVSGSTVVPAPPQSGLDQATALVALDNQACTYVFPTGAIDLESDTTHGSTGIYTPGVYCVNGAMSIGGGGIITLNGKGIYIFRSTGAFTSTDNSIVTLTGGAEACDVFWTPGQATTLGANTTFIGTVIDDAGITVGNMTSWTGRALSFGGTVTLDTNAITVPVCGVIQTATNTPSETYTATCTATLTVSNTNTATLTMTPTTTQTHTTVVTDTPTDVNTVTLTQTTTATGTITPSYTQTITKTITVTFTAINTAFNTATATVTWTSTQVTTSNTNITYPNPINPFVSDLRVAYFLNAGVVDARIMVYTSGFRLIMDMNLGAYAAGKNTAVIPGLRLQKLAKSVYYYVIVSKAADGTETKSGIRKIQILY